MPYKYDYTKNVSANKRTVRQLLRFIRMTLTRLIRRKTFHFNKKSYEYLYHFYNKTWTNERGVEIPIFRDIILNNQSKKILEIGNVLPHYYSISHDVLDKYEVGSGVINQDIISFEPTSKYDLIVSISTLEHIGWDEEPREPTKLLKAIEHMKDKCLAPGGAIIASLPIGLNDFFDRLLREGKSPFTEQYFLKRISNRNYWVESDWDSCRDAKYGRFVANAIVIGIISA